MNDTGHHARYNAWLKGDIRIDGFESPWLQSFNAYREQHKGKPQRFSAPHPKPQKRTPQPPRYCADCPRRLNHNNTCGYCKLHTPKVPKLKIAA